MNELDALREDLSILRRRLARGELDEATYDRLREKLLSDLTPAERAALGTPTPSETRTGGTDTDSASTGFVDLPVGTQLAGRYRVEERIGAGGLGVVYSVTDTRLDRPLAAKLLPPVLSRDPGAVALLEREVVNAQGLGHPHICGVFNLETDRASGVSFVLMELLEGATLRDVLRQHGRLPEKTVLAVAEQAFAALEHAHRKGVVHADVKPENLYWVGYDPERSLPEQQVELKVLDFGISTRIQETVTRLASYSGGGTAAYVAPELLRGEKAGPASDIYALGITLHELAAGEPPFQGANDSLVYELHRSAEPRRPDDMSNGLWALLSSCLAKGAGKRPDRWWGEGLSVPPPTQAARELQPGDVWEDPVLGMRFRYCPPGTFLMGSPEDQPERFGDEAQHRVKLTRGLWVGETEVTQRQYRDLTGESPSKFEGDDLPVESVSWFDVVRFANLLSERAGLEPCYRIGAGDAPDVELLGLDRTGFRLPTEAEWEYGSRAGGSGPYSGGGDVGAVAWYGDNSGSRPHPVGRKRANGWGLYDMSGNVWEWCWDWYGEYPTGSVTDPTGPSTGSNRVLRGGGWSYVARFCRSASRNFYDPGIGGSGLGFRLVRTAS